MFTRPVFVFSFLSATSSRASSHGDMGEMSVLQSGRETEQLHGSSSCTVPEAGWLKSTDWMGWDAIKLDNANRTDTKLADVRGSLLIHSLDHLRILFASLECRA